VLLDLLANAHRHTPEGTRVTVSGRAAAGEVRVTVRDSGPGIPTAELEAVFAPFHRRAGGGTGLGLANVRAIVAVHGGRVWAESGPGQGAAFHVVLPRHDMEREPR
jgi:signal transduction histidine kinase